MLQVKEIGSPLEVDEQTGELLSVKSERRLLVYSTDIHFGLVRDELVFTVPGCIYACGPDLAVQRGFSGDFRCRGFSADELGRLYMLVGENSPEELWVVSAANGQRERRLALAAEHRDVVQMPVIGCARYPVTSWGLATSRAATFARPAAALTGVRRGVRRFDAANRLGAWLGGRRRRWLNRNSTSGWRRCAGIWAARSTARWASGDFGPRRSCKAAYQ